MAGYNRHLSSDPNFLLEYMENMSDSDSDSDFDRYVDNPELDSEEEECSTSSFQNYPSHLSGLATSCPPAPPPSMSASLTPTHTHSTVLASSVLSTAFNIPTVAPSNSLAPAVFPSTVLAPSATVTVSQPTTLLPTVPPSTLPVSQSLTHSPAFSVSQVPTMTTVSQVSTVTPISQLWPTVVTHSPLTIQPPDACSTHRQGITILFFSQDCYTYLYYTNFTKRRICTVYHYLL